jgi:tRNA G10  N-methylase Trm11
VEVALVPRGMRDPRFAYRVADVPAASHPTIAAALARVAGVREDDVVWDPFVGSGLELAERARLGPYRSLLGTDLDADALDAARANLAGIEVKLTRSDALLTRPRAVTLIVTNPPMGRRVVRQGELRTFLERFVAHAASVLEPGGRLVWISPRPRMTRLHAERAGLRLERGFVVDMGGFQGEIQRWQK